MHRDRASGYPPVGTARYRIRYLPHASDIGVSLCLRKSKHWEAEGCPAAFALSEHNSNRSIRIGLGVAPAVEFDYRDSVERAQGVLHGSADG